jgi:hypothetical protein
MLVALVGIFSGSETLIRSESLLNEVLMKVAKDTIPDVEQRVWCEGCRVRLSPKEERVVLRGKPYHPRCRPKRSAAASKRRTSRS